MIALFQWEDMRCAKKLYRNIAMEITTIYQYMKKFITKFVEKATKNKKVYVVHESSYVNYQNNYQF